MYSPKPDRWRCPECLNLYDRNGDLVVTNLQTLKKISLSESKGKTVNIIGKVEEGYMISFTDSTYTVLNQAEFDKIKNEEQR